jgi:3,4-dihydroxy 2-butanone 4-phosphate synthase/GTP cyclohydrolase II
VSSHDISTIEAVIEEAKAGRPYILVDAEDRENEGDVIIPAQFATAEQINFMAKHARGLICLAITRARAQELRLPPMVVNNEAQHGTAFTVSIEAREGVTTGISAADRAETIRVAIDPAAGSDQIVSPGHIFPLVANDGGVLARSGHTEAAVDIARLAKLNPAGVICEVLNDDGTMARLPELIEFARLHGLKIGTIADLIAYRRRREHLMVRMLEIPFPSIYGDFRMVIYRNTLDQSEHVVLIKGEIDPDRPCMVRMHQVDITVDLLGHADARHSYVPRALATISAFDGPGVAVFIRESSPSSLSDRLGHGYRAYQHKSAMRDYGTGAQILLDLGVRNMILLTSSAAKLVAVEGYGLNIIERRAISAE